jgi:hypothetical protein
VDPCDYWAQLADLFQLDCAEADVELSGARMGFLLAGRLALGCVKRDLVVQRGLQCEVEEHSMQGGVEEYGERKKGVEEGVQMRQVQSMEETYLLPELL